MFLGLWEEERMGGTQRLLTTTELHHSLKKSPWIITLLEQEKIFVLHFTNEETKTEIGEQTLI